MGNLKDFATSTVATAPSPATTGTSLVVQAGHGVRYPATPFYIVAHPPYEMPTLDNAEKLLVTARTTDTLTITRAQGGTTAKSIATGWRISNSLFEEDFSDKVVGPPSATDNAIPRYDGPTGKLVQGSGVTIDDNNVIYAEGLQVSDNTFNPLQLERISADANAQGFRYIKSRGGATPGVQSGDQIARFMATGYIDDGSLPAASLSEDFLEIKSTEAWTSLARGRSLAFKTVNTGSTGVATRIFIDGAGDVGIGNISPGGFKLSVTGTVRASSGLTLAGTSATNADGMIFATDTFLYRSTAGSLRTDGKFGVGVGPVSQFHVYQNTTDVSSVGGITIEQAGTGDSQIQFLLTGVRRWVAGVDNSDSDKFKIASGSDLSSANTRFTIDVNGNVGIGASSPTQGRLVVSGGDIVTQSNSTLDQYVGGRIFAGTTSTATGNVTVDTSVFPTGNGTRTLPANFFTSGKTIRVELKGVYTSVLTTTGATVTVKLGATTIATVSTTALANAVTNGQWEGELDITCYTTGATGTVTCNGRVSYLIGMTSVAFGELTNAGATTTIDTTASQVLDIVVKFNSSQATQDIKTQTATIEVLN